MLIKKTTTTTTTDLLGTDINRKSESQCTNKKTQSQITTNSKAVAGATRNFCYVYILTGPSDNMAYLVSSQNPLFAP